MTGNASHGRTSNTKLDQSAGRSGSAAGLPKQTGRNNRHALLVLQRQSTLVSPSSPLPERIQLQGRFREPRTSDSSDLVSDDPVTKALSVKVKDLRLTSGFFADSGEFLFLRQDIDRSGEALNLWSLRAHPETGDIIRTPLQLSHLKGAVLSQLTGSRDGRAITMVRTERPIQIYVGEWRPTPHPMLQNSRRLTLEEVDSFPHAWTLDNQSVILESDRHGRLEIFRQKLTAERPNCSFPRRATFTCRKSRRMASGC